uniref:Uncharacterized protein n=2 Tax=Picea TaxID=3328 RepID=A0A117NGJ7_PICGL|nr:hypothetical protein ABT39_MTgene6348 [Picea glauca]QHR91419.1 hypothetical protein Q903MT_gene5453 [Picea sitchensis]
MPNKQVYSFYTGRPTGTQLVWNPQTPIIHSNVRRVWIRFFGLTRKTSTILAFRVMNFATHLTRRLSFYCLPPA